MAGVSVARRFEALDTTGIQNYTKKDTKTEKCLKEQKKGQIFLAGQNIFYNFST